MNTELSAQIDALHKVVMADHTHKFMPIFGGEHMVLRGWYCAGCCDWKEPVGREKFFTLENYSE